MPPNNMLLLGTCGTCRTCVVVVPARLMLVSRGVERLKRCTAISGNASWCPLHPHALPVFLSLQDPEPSVEQLGVSNVHELQRISPSGAPIFSLAEGPDYYPPAESSGTQKERTRDSQGGGQFQPKQVFCGNADKTVVAWSPPEYSKETRVKP